MQGQAQFGLYESEDEVRASRGTPRDTMLAIRKKFGLTPSVTDFDIFYRCISAYNGVDVANRTAEFHYQQYGRFIASGEPKNYQLPLPVLRAVDPDITCEDRAYRILAG